MCVSIYVYIYIYTSIHTYVYTYTHTYTHTYTSIYHTYLYEQFKNSPRLLFEHVGAKPHVRPHPKNTPKQYRILVIRGGMKTLAVRRDFDCCFVGFRVLT